MILNENKLAHVEKKVIVGKSLGNNTKNLRLLYDFFFCISNIYMLRGILKYAKVYLQI